MRKNIGLLALLAIAATSVLLFQACLKDKVATTYKVYTPVYTLKSTVLPRSTITRPRRSIRPANCI